MEDHEQVVVVDFANKYIGGGSLKKGAVQEEILFLIYPQLYVSILVCEKMNDNEAIYLSNFRRFANYEGYQTTLKFSSSAALIETRRDFIAIDAIKFEKPKNGTMGAQFTQHCILRELNKALVGFNLPEESRYSTISTGKWGCGAFNGDP